MGRIVRQLDEQRSESEKYQKLQQVLEESMPLLREQFLHEWLDGLWDDMQRIRRQVEFLHLPLPANKAIMPVLFSPEGGEESEAAAGYLTASMRKYIQDRMPGAAVCAQSQTVVALAAYEQYPDRQAFIKTLEDICAYIRGLHGVHLAVCVGNPVDDWAEVPASLQQAYDVLENRLLSNEGRILYCDTAPDQSPAPGAKFKPALLSEAVHAGNEAQVMGMLEDIRKEVCLGRMNFNQARVHMMSVALITEMELGAMGAQPADAQAFVKEALGMLTYEGIHRGITALMKTAFENIRALRTAQYDRTVSKICDIIRQRYSARLTIEALAQEAHYSPAYLSELFRQETGQTIGNFMLQVRMEKAMERLRTTRDSIFQIAEDVGYAEQTHFTRLFKRYTGMTPLEYRKKVIL
jgi:two-component system response regulator YesN